MDLSLVDFLVFSGMTIAAFSAGVVQLKSALKGVPALRVYRAIGAALCFFYTLGYIVVLGGFIEPALWSQIFRPVAFATWPLVWMFPVIITDRIWRDINKGLTDLKKEVDSLE